MRWRKIIYPIPLELWNSYIFTHSNRLEDVTSVFTAKQSLIYSITYYTHSCTSTLLSSGWNRQYYSFICWRCLFFNYNERMYRSISQSQLPRITNETNKTEFDCNWNVFFSAFNASSQNLPSGQLHWRFIASGDAMINENIRQILIRIRNDKANENEIIFKSKFYKKQADDDENVIAKFK